MAERPANRTARKSAGALKGGIMFLIRGPFFLYPSLVYDMISSVRYTKQRVLTCFALVLFVNLKQKAGWTLILPSGESGIVHTE
jgi:hypothetical protein